ncbi:MAG: translocation/assembly module TamB domain-containing protein [Desulfohalobiaceae bacterium]|nr:translocation/assembly module TamB domain-containing protein [Desulfohalobiaceae bacterium]
MFLHKKILRLIKWAAITCLGLFLLSILAFIMVQTQTARTYLLVYLEKTLSRDELRVELSGIQGWLPVDFTLDEATISDVQGPFLKISRVHLAWSPLQLLSGTIRVRNIGAAEVDFKRRPELPAEPGDKDRGQEKAPGDFSLPSLLVERIDFPHIALGAELTADPAVFSLTGKMDMTSLARLEGDLSLKRIDRPGLRTQLQADYREPLLHMDWRFESPGRGLLQVLLGRELPGPIDFRLQGRGPIKDWQAELRLVLEDKPVLASSLKLNYTEKEARLKGLSTFLTAAAGYLPPPYSKLVDSDRPLPFAFDLVYNRSANLLRLETAELSTDWADLNIRGTADLGKQTLEHQIELIIHELSGLQPLSPLPLKGSARIQARIDGPWKLPEARVGVAAGPIEVGDYTVTKTSLDLILAPEAGRKNAVQSVELSGISRVRGFSNESLSLKLPSAEVSFNSSYSPESGLTLRRLKLGSPNENLTLSGQLENNGRFRAEIQATLKEIQDLSLDVALPLSGGLKLTGRASGDWLSREVSARMRTSFLDLGGLPEDMLVLTGKDPGLEFNLGLNDNRVSLNQVTLQGDHLDLNLNGSFGLERRDVDLNWDLTGPRLEQLSFSGDLNCQGRVEAFGSLQGLITNMKATMEATIADFSLPPLLPSRLTIRAGASGLPGSPSGDLALDLAGSKHSLRLSTGFAFTDRVLRLNHIQAQAPDTELSGSLDLNLQKSSLQTNIDLRARDFSWLQAFIPDPGINGGLTLGLTAAGDLGNPEVNLELQGRDLAYAGINAAELSAEIRLLDLQRQKIDLRLFVRSLETGAVLLRQSGLTIKGDRDAYALTLDLRGKAREPFRLQTRGRVAITDTLQRIVLESGTGGFGSIPLSWSKPLAFERSGQDLRLSCPGLNLGQGELRVTTGLEQDRLQGRISLSGFDLSTLEAEALPPLLGQISLELGLAGTPKRPELDLETSIQGLQPVGADLPEIHPITADLIASYRQDNFQAELQAASLGGDVKTSLQVPSRLSLRPFVLKPGDGLKGSALINADLGAFGGLFDLEGQQVDGRLKADLGFSGSLPVPDLNGRAVLEQGSYENVRSGTILRDLSLQCTFEDKTIHLQSLNASDGKEGKISANGRLSLLENDFSAEARLLLDKARLVRLDFLEGQTDGEIGFTKDVTGSSLSGELTIAPIEVRIPEARPQGLEGLRIVRTGSRTEASQKNKSGKTQPSVLSALNLDIRISIPSRCFVRGKGLDSEWQGDFRITNTAAEPKINGNISLIRGHVDFLTKRFDLEKGLITFVNEIPPKPILDIQAETSSDDLSIFLSITGSTTNPELTLSSEPSLPRDEILARLLFGHELSRITPVQAVKLALAVRTLRSGGNDQGIMDKFRQTMGLDELDIKTEPGEEGGTVVGMGKYLNENIYFKVEQGLGSESSEVIVQIELTPRITLESSAGSVNQEFGLLWEYSY